MNFSGILGNESLKDRLSSMLCHGQMLQSFLITGPAGSGKKTLALWLSAALQCNDPNAPCLLCSACRKIMAGTHPDVLICESDRQTIPVETVRAVCADVWVQPTEGQRRIAVIPRGDALNAQGQNALLKTIEEPPDHCTFLILCENTASLLPTVRSRCAILPMAPLSRETILNELANRFPQSTHEQRQKACDRSSGYLGRAIDCLQAPENSAAETLAMAFSKNNALAAFDATVGLERMKRDDLVQTLEALLSILGDALLYLSGGTCCSAISGGIAKSRTGRDISDAILGTRRLLLWTRSNVGAGHLAGALAVLLYKPEQFSIE